MSITAEDIARSLNSQTEEEKNKCLDLFLRLSRLSPELLNYVYQTDLAASKLEIGWEQIYKAVVTYSDTFEVSPNQLLCNLRSELGHLNETQISELHELFKIFKSEASYIHDLYLLSILLRESDVSLNSLAPLVPLLREHDLPDTPVFLSRILKATPVVNDIFFNIDSYSQEGEDLILRSCFPSDFKGFYVDVGAHHPLRFSNTQYFYQKGWHGINIDPSPGSKELFDKYRPRDVNLQLAICEIDSTASLYLFSESALNTLCPIRKDRVEKITPNVVTKTIEVPTCPLSKILKENTNTKIDFLNVDVEGSELNVLKSNDWNAFSPTIILIEILNFDPVNPLASESYRFLNHLGYSYFAKSNRTVFLKKE